MKKILNIIVTIVAIISLTYFSYQTYSNAKKLENTNRVYYEAQSDISDLIQRKFSSILSTLTLGTLDIKEKEKININELKANKIVLKDKIDNLNIKLAIVSVVIVLLYFLLSKTAYALLISISSLIMLIFGVITPILMIVIHKNVNYLGDIVLSFESKTIIGTIKHLYESQNYPVAITILLFSIIVPLIKTLLMITITIFQEFHIAQKLLKVFKHLGKWSMLDVFVVSLLLVYLSMGSSQNSYSEIESGLYMFLIYVIMSIISSIVVDKILSKKT